eukprot:Plantae.Rhodophyta-Hildenbrandia_rubra.ctg9104.p1 GENE.Plantae.Rhodophyta-Hildenbrandia_rubra.ctg9104~~Plantae.Rhodophyta-Hildenbrandia_rubra.ctg9104.p1  ORF type:complete len:259 (-),score=59.31 Plantae.Rhodophyta-Hildenbrandia_rubra.ctg9104:943-1719(-)
MDYGPLVRVFSTPTGSATTRPDGRTALNEPRQIFLRAGFITQASGSAYFEAGGTKLFAAVYGPRADPGSVSSQARVVCEVRYARFGAGLSSKYGGGSGFTRVSDDEREMGLALGRVLAGSICLDRYPKTRIDVEVFVVEDDGGVVAGAVTAASAALADARIELVDLMAGCVAGFTEDGKVVADPCAKEEKECVGKLWVAYMPQMRKVMDIGHQGEIELQTLVEATRMCAGSAGHVVGLTRNCLIRKAKKLKKGKSTVT